MDSEKIEMETEKIEKQSNGSSKSHSKKSKKSKKKKSKRSKKSKKSKKVETDVETKPSTKATKTTTKTATTKATKTSTTKTPAKDLKSLISNFLKKPGTNRLARKTAITRLNDKAYRELLKQVYTKMVSFAKYLNIALQYDELKTVKDSHIGFAAKYSGLKIPLFTSSSVKASKKYVKPKRDEDTEETEDEKKARKEQEQKNEIKYYQETTGLLCPRAPFITVLKMFMISDEDVKPPSISDTSCTLAQSVFEIYIQNILQGASFITSTCKRKTVNDDDIRLAIGMGTHSTNYSLPYSISNKNRFDLFKENTGDKSSNKAATPDEQYRFFVNNILSVILKQTIVIVEDLLSVKKKNITTKTIKFALRVLFPPVFHTNLFQFIENAFDLEVNQVYLSETKKLLKLVPHHSLRADKKNPKDDVPTYLSVFIGSMKDYIMKSPVKTPRGLFEFIRDNDSLSSVLSNYFGSLVV